MTIFLESLPPVAEILGWTLLHSLWQGMVIAMLVELIRRQLPARASRMRYALAFAGLNLMLLSVVTTFLVLRLDTEGSAFISPTDTSVSQGPQSPFPESLSIIEAGSGFDDWVPFLTILWLAGYIFLLIRFLVGRMSLLGLRSSASELRDPWWTERFMVLARKMDIGREVHLMTSTLTSVPFTFGWLKPVILLPVGLVNHLDPQEVEAILIHELAHILRRDFLWNTWQQCLECLFYYHPMTWWLSRQITDEREHLCDEITLRQQTNALTYARALLHIQEWHALPRHAALAATGRKDALLHRIQRIIDHSVKPDTMQRKWLIPVLLVLPVLATTLMAWMPSTGGRAENDHLSEPTALIDSLPQKKIIRKDVRKDIQHIVEEHNGQRQEATFENGELTELLINGETIAPADFGKHKDLIERMHGNASRLAPPPPPPPTPPSPPQAPDAPQVMDEEVMEWTTEDGQHEKTIIIRKEGQPGIRTEKRIEKIIIEGDEEPLIWTEKQGIAPGEKRIEIIRKKALAEGNDSHVYRFRSDGNDPTEQMLRIEKELAEQEGARALEGHTFFFKDDSGGEERHVEIRIQGDGQEMDQNLRFFGERSGSIHERMAARMLKEGLIQSRNDYKYDLNTKRLKIDGHRMPTAVHQRYLKLYKEYTGQAMTDKDRLRADIAKD